MSHMTNAGPSGHGQPEANKAMSSPAKPVVSGAIGAAWNVAVKNPSLTLAVFLIQLPLTYALSQVSAEKAARISFQAHSWYELFISGFVTFGVYRCALAAARTGKSCSFWAAYSQGAAYWGRNFRLSWVIGLCQLGLFLAVFIPAAFVFWVMSELLGDDKAPIILVSVGILALYGLVLALRAGLRMALSTAWLADGQHGYRSSAQEAVRESWAMTRGRELGPLYAGFWMGFLGYVMWTLLVSGVYWILGEGLDGYVSFETAAWADIALSLPESFLSVWISCIFAMLYLRYSAPASYPAR